MFGQLEFGRVGELSFGKLYQGSMGGGRVEDRRTASASKHELSQARSHQSCLGGANCHMLSTGLRKKVEFKRFSVPVFERRCGNFLLSAPQIGETLHPNQR